jgi:prepilin-type N-terminal cleavage/methylation domain-containing protein
MMERINQLMRARLDEENGTGGETGEEGFTLVELLIVVVVLGILAAVTVFGLSGTTSTSYKAACNADARSVEIAAETYHANNSPNWPPDIATLTAQDPNNGNVVYLRTAPNSTKYTITLGANGAVLVNTKDYDAGLNSSNLSAKPPVDNNPCDAIP